MHALTIFFAVLLLVAICYANDQAGGTKGSRKLMQKDYILYKTINETVNNAEAAERKRQEERYSITDEIKLAINRGHHAFWFPQETRQELGPVLNAFGRTFAVGVELNPNDCSFATELLGNWTHSTKYYMVGSWTASDSKDDPLSQTQAKYDSDLKACKAINNVKAAVIRVQDEVPKRSSVPDHEVDFIFISDLVRHDYCSMAATLKEWWPKLKVGKTPLEFPLSLAFLGPVSF